MIAIIIGTVVLAAAAVLVLAARKPDSFRVERNILIQAAPSAVFPFLDDPRRQAEWSPWDKKDPAMKKTYSGAAKGTGAVYEWDGNKEIGAGRLEIVEVVPDAKVVMDLRFTRPMAARNVGAYAVTPKEGGSSEVSWSISGPLTFPAKLFHVFVDMDAMIGREFEKGLADLKSLAEKRGDGR